MPLTAAVDAEGPGKARTSPMLSLGGRTIAVATGTLAFDASYPTGGEDATAISENFREVLAVFIESDGTRIYKYNKTTNKILAYSALGTEVTNAADLSAVTAVRWFAVGRP